MKLNRFAVYCWIVLGYSLAVILWGAYVRASGSGAGCGSHWPLCNGEVIPRLPQIETLIELTHRVTSGLALLLIIGLVVWAFRAYPRKHRVRLGAGLSGFFILTEALVGAGLVLLELVAGNTSIARALFMSIHLTNTFLLIAVLSLTAWWASGGPPVQLKETGSLGLVLGLGLLGALVIGISGAVAALGDTLFPASSLAEGLRQDFSPTAHVLVRLRILHPAIAIAVSCYLVFAAKLAIFLRPTIWVKTLTWVLVALIGVQLGAGLLNVWLRAPYWLQLTHLFLADLLWIALVILTASVFAQKVHESEKVKHLNLSPALEA